MSTYNPPKDVPNCFINAFPNKNDNFKLIGPQGNNLKRITEMLKVTYIWLHLDKNVIEIYGDEKKLPKAIRYFEKYLTKFYKKHCIVQTYDHQDKRQRYN